MVASWLPCLLLEHGRMSKHILRSQHRSVPRNSWKNQAPSILNVASKWCYIGTSFIFCISLYSKSFGNEKITSNMIMIYNLQLSSKQRKLTCWYDDSPYYSESSGQLCNQQIGEGNGTIGHHPTPRHLRPRHWQDEIPNLRSPEAPAGTQGEQTCYPLSSMTMPGNPLVFVLID